MVMTQPSSKTNNAFLHNKQLEDDTTGPILKARPGKSLRRHSRAVRQLFQLWDQLVVVNGVLYRRFEYFKGKQDHLQLVVPSSMRDTILEESHAGSLGGHLGEDRTLGRVREKFFWPGYAEQVRQWCRTCVRCATRKNPSKTRHGALQSVRTGYPMQMVATDIMGPLPPSKHGNRYILVVSDYFTRWVEAYAIPNQEATTIAHKLVNNMFCRFSLPE